MRRARHPRDLVNGPAFDAPDAKAFSRSPKFLAATTDTGQAWKKAFSVVLRGAANPATAFGKDAGPLKALGGQKLTQPLGETFSTQAPFRYGRYVAKPSLSPAAESSRRMAVIWRCRW